MFRPQLVVATALFVLLGCERPSPEPSPHPNPAPALEPESPMSSPPPKGTRVENPRYREWAAHKLGTTVVIRETTVTPAYTTETKTILTLKKVADDHLVVEVTGQVKAPDGTEYPPTTQDMNHRRWAFVPDEEAKADRVRPIGTVEERGETITVLGREYKAKWYKSKGRVEAGETITETWISDEIPGGIARSVHNIPGAKKSITSDVVEIKSP